MSMDSHRHLVSPLIFTTSCTFSILASMLPTHENAVSERLPDLPMWQSGKVKIHRLSATNILDLSHYVLRVKDPVCILWLFSPYIFSLSNVSVSHDSRYSFPHDLAKSHPHILLFPLALSDDLCESTVSPHCQAMLQTSESSFSQNITSRVRLRLWGQTSLLLFSC